MLDAEVGIGPWSRSRDEEHLPGQSPVHDGVVFENLVDRPVAHVLVDPEDGWHGRGLPASLFPQSPGDLQRAIALGLEQAGRRLAGGQAEAKTDDGSNQGHAISSSEADSKTLHPGSQNIAIRVESAEVATQATRLAESAQPGICPRFLSVENFSPTPAAGRR